MAKSVTYTNGCMPLELNSTSVRWYFDSDVGRRLAGQANLALSSGTQTHSSSTAISSSPTEVATTNNDFVYVKNTGSTDVLVTLDNSNYLIKLSQDESFASEISTSANVKVKTASGNSTIETFVGT